MAGRRYGMPNRSFSVENAMFGWLIEDVAVHSLETKINNSHCIHCTVLVMPDPNLLDSEEQFQGRAS